MPATAVSVKLTDEEKSRLAAVAKRTKRSSHYVLRQALLSHLRAMENRLDFIAEAEESWRDYRKTGLYISAEAMEKWAGVGGELPPLEKKWDK